MALPPYAVAVILDNSDTAIDGDFIPNRFDAQKTAVDRLSQYYLSTNPESQFGINTMASEEFGIRSSFTSNHQKIMLSMQNIKIGGKLLFQKALKNALLSLKHCNAKTEEKRVLAFIGNDHDINSPEIVKKTVNTFKREDVSLDIVIIGKSVPNVPFLKKICREIPKSFCIEVRECDTVLSDKVLKSEIRPGKKISQINPREFGMSDPNFIRALEMSEAFAREKKEKEKKEDEKEKGKEPAEVILQPEKMKSSIIKAAQIHKTKKRAKKND